MASGEKKESFPSKLRVEPFTQNTFKATTVTEVYLCHLQPSLDVNTGMKR